MTALKMHLCSLSYVQSTQSNSVHVHVCMCICVHYYHLLNSFDLSRHSVTVHVDRGRQRVRVSLT